MKLKFKQLLDALYKADHDWQRFKRNYEDRKTAYENGLEINMKRMQKDITEFEKRLSKQKSGSEGEKRLKRIIEQKTARLNKLPHEYHEKLMGLEAEYKKREKQYKKDGKIARSIAVQKTADFMNTENHNTIMIRDMKKGLAQIEELYKHQRAQTQNEIDRFIQNKAALKEIIIACKEFIEKGAPKLDLVPKDLRIKGNFKPKVEPDPEPPKLPEKEPEKLPDKPEEDYTLRTDEDGIEWYKCAYCDKEYNSEPVIKGHVTKYHKEG